MREKLFQVDTIENVGDHWLIADFGTDLDGKHYILTTYYMRASETSALGTVKEQADLVCQLLNDHYLGRKEGTMKQLRLELPMEPIAVGTRVCCALCLDVTHGRVSLVWQPPDYKRGICHHCGQEYVTPGPYGAPANE